MVSLESQKGKDMVMLLIRFFFRYSSFLRIRNLIRNRYEFLVKKRRLRSIPPILKVEPTNICNLDCSVCPAHPYRKKEKKGYLSYDSFVNYVSDYLDKVYLISFSLWGEPLLNDQIYPMIQYASDHNVGTFMSSNLNSLTKEKAEKLVSCGLDVLSISLDADTEEIYSKMRSGGNFDVVLKNIQTVVEARNRRKSSLTIILQFLISPQTEDRIEDLKELGKKLGVDKSVFYPIYHFSKGELCSDKNKNFWIFNVNKKTREQILEKRNHCFFHWTSMSIRWNGEVHPCCATYSKRSYGNLNTSPLSDIWNNNTYQKVRSDIKDSRLKMNPCLTCPIIYKGLFSKIK